MIQMYKNKNTMFRRCETRLHRLLLLARDDLSALHLESDAIAYLENLSINCYT